MNWSWKTRKEQNFNRLLVAPEVFVQNEHGTVTCSWNAS